MLAKSKSDGGQSSFLLLLHHFGRFIRKPTTKADEDEDYSDGSSWNSEDDDEFFGAMPEDEFDHVMYGFDERSLPDDDGWL